MERPQSNSVSANRIRLLPEQVANQIAAGEVVERPASVVKELVENSLDANSRRITIEIQAGGRSLIRVTDDGIGMNRDDALLCLERHATSKIQRAEDLTSIDTMGFRGEAMPSIASVSRMTLTSRPHDGSVAATQIIINGGKLLECREAGAPPGTCVEVRQLFFNLPARRKFLRSEETEYTHVYHYLTLAALAHPAVGFTLVRDGRTIFQLPAVADSNRLAALKERLIALSNSPEELLPLDFSAELPAPSARNEPDEDEEPGRLVIWGFIGRPGASRSSRQDQHLFVNRRPVDNRGLNYALQEGYHTALMKGRYPVCTLFLEIDPALVDVNIHPAKREVKFRNEFAVRQLATQAVRQALMAYHTTPQPAAPARPEIEDSPPAAMPVELPNWPAPHRPTPPPAPRVPATFVEALSRTNSLTPPPERVAPERTRDVGPIVDAPMPSSAQIRSEPPSARHAPLLEVPLRLIGVLAKLYVLYESDRGLVLLDQHAAHERVLFEQMLNRMQQDGQAPSQRLLLPETVELPIRDAHFVREQLATLNRLGVSLSEFGEQTFLLDALPPFVRVTDARRFVLVLIDELKASGQAVNALRLGEDVIAKTVCRHAVKANDPLAEPELEKLIDDLRQCAMPYTCPHGRPTLIEMSYRELEKKFGRLV
jgi:DNA mismatch repair protein MutL